MGNIKLRFVNILLIVIFNSFVICDHSSGTFFKLFEKFWKKEILKITYIKEFQENSLLTTDEQIIKSGYPLEEHFVTTEDGYILELHRIPHPKGKPMLLVSGFAYSDNFFVITGPKFAPAYYLWEKDYDVWLGNLRGNMYSKNHTSLDPDKKPFWNFSFHEMGIYDLPAMVDYVLDTTKRQKLTYLGYSQGTAIFFVMCSKRPEYNKKINLMHAVAPTPFVSHIYSITRPLSELFLSTPYSNYTYELLPAIKSNKRLCSNGEKIKLMCQDTIVDRILIYNATGFDFKLLDKIKLPTTYEIIPTGTATKALRHIFQMAKSNRFCEFDYGTNENLAYYGQREPPNYDLSKIKVPIALYSSYTDNYAVPPDVETLHRKLGTNVIASYKILGLWNHFDFVLSIDARKVIYEKVISINNKIEAKNSNENNKK